MAALGGFGQGALVGGVVGSVVPGLGTAAGATGGGIAGAVALRWFDRRFFACKEKARKCQTG